MRLREPDIRTRALIAHDHRKAHPIARATFNRETLGRVGLVATRHTAEVIARKVGLPAADLIIAGLSRREEERVVP
jgi:methylglyoxal synthase